MNRKDKIRKTEIEMNISKMKVSNTFTFVSELNALVA